MSIPAAGPARSGWKVLAVVGATAYLTFIFLVFTGYWVHEEGDWASAFGDVLGSALIPTVIVLAYYKRKKQKASAARVMAVLASWVFIANLFNISRIKPHLTRADIPIIAREAAGLVPIKDPNDAGRTAVREYFREIIAQNKAYVVEVDKIGFQDLYTPKSYAHEQEAKRIIARLEAALDVEARQEAALNDIVGHLRAGINALNWPEGQKKAFVKGFEDKYQETAAIRRALLESERQWINSVIDLYYFALKNHRYFRAGKEQVLITSPEVLDQFNEKIRHINELRERFQAASKTFEQSQKSFFADLGVSAHDFGLNQ